MSGLEFSRNQKLALCALVGLSAIGMSINYARTSLTPSAGEVVVREAGSGPHAQVVTSGSDLAPASGASQVIFQVAGCVKAPGVYSLPKGERVIAAVNAAGGAKENADLQSLNLATRIEDGSRIYVPSLQETRSGLIAASGSASAVPVQASRGSHISTAGVAAGGKLRIPGEGTVNINTAGPDELQRLPGVGPATAQKIIDYRNQVGRFTSAEQLVDVKGIGPKTYEKMRPFLRI